MRYEAAFGLLFFGLIMDIATRQKLCLAILRGTEQEAFAEHRVSEANQALLRKYAHEISRSVLANRHPAKRYWRAPIRRPMRWPVIAAGAIATFCSFYAVRLFPLIQLDKPDTYPLATSFSALLAIAAASVGWAVTSVVSARNSRINQTLTIASERFTKSDFSRNANIFNTFFQGKRINKELVDSLAKSADELEREALQSLRYLLNFFEYVSVGVLLGELDELIIQKTLRGNLKYYYDRCVVYIREEQAFNPRVLENLTMLRAHFEDV